MNVPLNPYQRRAVAIALAHLERAVGTVEETLLHPSNDLLNPVEVDIGPTRQREIAARLAQVRAAITEAAARFDLEATKQDGARVAAAALLSSWEGLEDIHARKLARYGTVDPAIAPLLDPMVDYLIGLVLDVTALLRDPGDRSG